MVSTLDAALWYADNYGWKIVPGFLDEFDRKRPWVQGWSENASSDPETIQSWWNARPDSLVGLCCGLSNVIVVDIDIHDEFKNGFESLHAMLRGIGRDIDWFDCLTVVSRSGGGGKHYIFHAPEGIDLTKRKIEWKPGIDILIGGSFVVLPPSPHPSGTAYAWEPGSGPHERAVGEVPPELVQELLKTTQAINPEERANSARYQDILEQGSGAGRRNNDLIRLIGWLRRKIGDSPEARVEIRAKLELWRDKCDPAYRGANEDDEFERTWLSGLQLPHAPYTDWFQDALAVAGFEGETTRDLSLWMEPRIGATIRSDVMGELFFWNGRCWEGDDPKHIASYGMLDKSGVIDAFQRDTDSAARDLEAAGQARDASRLRKWSAIMRERAPMIDAMRMVTGRQTRVYQADWDPHPHLLHCWNGVLDLKNGVLLPHDPGLMNRTVCRTNWNPTAGAARAWKKLLDYMLPDDWDTQRYVCAAFGFSLWGNNHQKALFVLHGEANNGKSTLLQSFLEVIGVAHDRSSLAYAGLIEKKVMAESKTDQHPAGLADALLKRMGVMSSEWGMGDKLNLELVKAITGDDLLSARFMREDFGVFKPKVTPWIATNHGLQLREFDSSIRARLKLIELHGTIPEDKRRDSHEVRAELLAESEQILHLVVQEMLRARGLGGLGAIEPQSLKDAVTEAIDAQDTVMQWFEAYLVDLRDEAATAAEGVLEGEAMKLVIKERGALITELHAHFEAIPGNHRITTNLFSQRLCKILKVKGSDLPKVQRGGLRSTAYPVRFNSSGGGFG